MVLIIIDDGTLILRGTRTEDRIKYIEKPTTKGPTSNNIELRHIENNNNNGLVAFLMFTYLNQPDLPGILRL